MGFETTISAGERPKTYALGRAATGIGADNLVEKYGINKAIYATLALRRVFNKCVVQYHKSNCRFRFFFNTVLFIMTRQLLSTQYSNSMMFCTHNTAVFNY
jgi:hypothetical protein